MLTKTEAIILNKIKYSDNTYIITLFTREFGRIAAFVRMNNKSKIDQKPAIFFPLNIIDTEINFKNTSELQNLKFCENKYILTNLFTDIVKIAISQFVAEIIIKTIKEQCANKVLFEYIKEFILKLNNKKEKYSDFHIFFLRDFAAIEGFEIYNNFSEQVPYFNFREGMFLPIFHTSDESLDEINSKLLSDFLKVNFNVENNYTFKYQTRKKILELLLKYYNFHFPSMGEINSIRVLEDIFTS